MTLYFIDEELIDPESYVFTFGQYKGIEYTDVAYDDPGYILWCVENLDWFNVDEEELIRLTSLAEDGEGPFDSYIADEYDYVD